MKNLFILSTSFKTESRLLFKLALPILLAQLAITSLGVVDTIMSGWVGTIDLAAIGLGSNIMLPIFIFGTGVLLAITPLVSKAKGQQNVALVSQFLHQGLIFAIPLGVFSSVLLMNLHWLLNLLSLETAVYNLTADYLYYIAYGLPGIALYQVLRFFWEGLERTLPTMWISLFALLLNIPLNAIFIYGFGPIEAMGAAGCGVASALVMWSMFFIALGYVLKNSYLKPYFNLSKLFIIEWEKGLKPILALGIPNSFALLFEVGMFSFIALFIAVLGSSVIAAHQIAISFTSLAFMVPLSLALALTVRTGRGFGQNSKKAVQTTIKTGFIWALLIGSVLAFISYYFRHIIVGIYSDDLVVIKLAVTLLVFAAMYQVFDAIQVSAAGVLRGFHDTKVTMWVTLMSYWGIGLGIGYLFAFGHFSFPLMGVSGFWLGIVLGLSLAAILLSIRLKVIFNVHFKK